MRVIIALIDLVEAAARRGVSCAIGICEVDSRAVALFDISVLAIGKGKDYPSYKNSTMADLGG